MGKRPCCSKEDGLRKGAWTDDEDRILTHFISRHGVGCWNKIPSRAGLKRCGKSCRLRWRNYLRPDLKRGNITPDEESLIVRLHKLLGNRWSLIAGRLPGRSDNEIKNYWNTKLKRKVDDGMYRDIVHSNRPLSEQSKDSKHDQNKGKGNYETQKIVPCSFPKGRVIRPKAFKCTKAYMDPSYMSISIQQQQLTPVISTAKLPSCASTTMACDDLAQAIGQEDFLSFDFDVKDFDLAHLYDATFQIFGVVDLQTRNTMNIL